jgi:3-oxoacyl-(acyl-carrier-protein) synthase
MTTPVPDGIVVTGLGAVCGAPDPSPFLRLRKMRKFMGRQDDLAVTAAGRALGSASLTAPLGERCGLYLTVGYIPFESADIESLVGASIEEGRFSMKRFAVDGFKAINPLLTFRVLPNMPAFHVSLNFDLQGPYRVTYPGIGQFYSALEEAAAALDAGAVDAALVGAVADQQNFLVEHHFGRLSPPVPADRLVNAAAFLLLERAPDAAARGACARARMTAWEMHYVPADTYASVGHAERVTRDGVGVETRAWYGPASLGVALSGGNGRLTHEVRTRDGFTALSVWDVA